MLANPVPRTNMQHSKRQTTAVARRLLDLRRTVSERIGNCEARGISDCAWSTTDQTLKLLKVVPTGKGPQETCISPDGKRAYVSNPADISGTALDLGRIAAASTIPHPRME